MKHKTLVSLLLGLILVNILLVVPLPIPSASSSVEYWETASVTVQIRSTENNGSLPPLPPYFPTIQLDLTVLTTDLNFFWWQDSVTAVILVTNRGTIGKDVTLTWKLLDQQDKVVASGKGTLFISGLEVQVPISLPLISGSYTLDVLGSAHASTSIHISPVFILGDAVQFFALLSIIIVVLIFVVKRRRHR